MPEDSPEATEACEGAEPIGDVVCGDEAVGDTFGNEGGAVTAFTSDWTSATVLGEAVVGRGMFGETGLEEETVFG